MVFAGNALFPRLGHRLRWPTRLGPRGFTAYVAVVTLVRFALLSYALPRLARMAEEREHAAQELRQRLGREPTEQELLAHRLAAGRPRLPIRPPAAGWVD